MARAKRKRAASTRVKRGRAATVRGTRGKAASARSAASTSAEATSQRERLWAPWRMRWIRQADAPGGCLFCRVARSSFDRAHLVLARRPQALLMLNRFPYNPAHLMVAVRRHKGQVSSLTADERGDWLDLVSLAERALAKEYAPHGVNYGANVGRVAGAGFPDHLHLHLVPRWDGDTNFMPVIGRTRVLPESLAETWRRLRRAIRALGAPRGA